MEKIESAQPVRRRSTPRKGPASILLEEHSASTRLDSQLNDCSQRLVDSVARQNLTSAIQHGSRRKSLSESLVVDPNCLRSNIFFCNQFDHDEEYNYNTYTKMDKNSKESSLPQVKHYLLIKIFIGKNQSPCIIKIYGRKSVYKWQTSLVLQAGL